MHYFCYLILNIFQPTDSNHTIVICVIAWVAKQSDGMQVLRAFPAMALLRCHLAHSRQVARRGILPRERETKKMLSRRWAKFLVQRGFAGEGHCFANVRTKESWINSGAKAHHSFAHKAEGAHLRAPYYIYIYTYLSALFSTPHTSNVRAAECFSRSLILCKLHAGSNPHRCF